jgi:hypothetical protein
MAAILVSARLSHSVGVAVADISLTKMDRQADLAAVRLKVVSGDRLLRAQAVLPATEIVAEVVATMRDSPAAAAVVLVRRVQRALEPILREPLF